MRRLIVGTAACLIAAPAFGFDLIAGPATPAGAGEEPATFAPTAYAPTATQDYDRGGLFDELRVGGSGSIDASADAALSVGGTVLFDPLALRFESAFATDFLSPRPHVGFALSPASDSKLYAGFTWDVQISDLFFLEAGLGGAVHDRQLPVDEADADQILGCRFALRQSVGAGVEMGERFRVMASVDHETDGGLCGESGNLTHAGAAIGYKF